MAAGAADAAGDAAAMRAAVLPSSKAVVASRAVFFSSLMITYLSSTRTAVSSPSGLGTANSMVSAVWPAAERTIAT
jgi:hypothetical protein